MKKISYALVLFFSLFFNQIFSQNIEIGYLLNLNTNFISLKSDYKIENDIKYKPAIGFGGGLFIAKPITDKFEIYSSFEFLMIQNNLEPGQFTYDFSGTSSLSLGEEKIKNSSVNIEILPSYIFSNNTFIRG